MTLNRYRVTVRSTRNADDRFLVVEAASADDAMAIARINHCVGSRWDGAAMVPLEVAAAVVGLPAKSVDRAETVLRQTTAMILAECASAELPAPPEGLHPADVVEKHLCRGLHQRINAAEERAAKAEKAAADANPFRALQAAEFAALHAKLAAAEKGLAAARADERTRCLELLGRVNPWSAGELREALSNDDEWKAAPEALDEAPVVQADLHDGTICGHCGAPCGMRHAESCPEAAARRDGTPG